MKAIQELYEKMLWLVCDYAELPADEVLNSNREECVNARCALVKVLSEWMTDEEIAKYTGLTRAGVNKLRNGARERMRRYSFKCLVECVQMVVESST